MKNISDIALKLANKLYCEGITKENYSKEKALEISSRCAGVAVLNYILNNHEEEVIKLLS